jgi:methyltransferase (TIGR00027 family)
MPSAPEPLAGVSETALGAAEMRAAESRRSDRLFDDGYADAFVSAAPPLFADIAADSDDGELAALVEVSVSEVAVRTRFYDDFLMRACAAGCRQVVLLGAGLETRAFRMPWPDGVRMFELDLPGLFAFKERVLAEQKAIPQRERRVVPVDLRDNWPPALLDAGFVPNDASVWTAEGLLVYLASDDAERLLLRVGQLSASGSRLSFEYGEAQLDQVRSMPAMEEVTSLWDGGLGDRAPEWLREHGWHVQTLSRDTLAEFYERTLLSDAGTRFLTAERLDGAPA